MIFTRLFFCLLVCLVNTIVSGTAHASISVPEGYDREVSIRKSKVYECKTAPEPYVRPLNFPSKYEGSGRARDQLSPDAEREYKALTSSITEFEQGIAQSVSRYISTGEMSNLTCAISWMSTWAQGGALLAKAENQTGVAVRKWTLASLSGTYLRLKRSRTKPLADYHEQEVEIDKWIGKLADIVASEAPTDVPLSRINNHSYWAAWSLMASAAVLDRDDLYVHSKAIYALFEKQIDSRGLLENEVKRASRALGYHAYSLTPLAMIASFLLVNEPESKNQVLEPLSRLANATFGGNFGSSLFTSVTGVKQSIETSNMTKFSWLEPYCSVSTCNAQMLEELESIRPVVSTRLGGNLTDIFAKVKAQ